MDGERATRFAKKGNLQPHGQNRQALRPRLRLSRRQRKARLGCPTKKRPVRLGETDCHFPLQSSPLAAIASAVSCFSMVRRQPQTFLAISALKNVISQTFGFSSVF